MKVCTGLNPLHTSLAIFGCLLGYDRIYEEMKNLLLRRFVTRLACDEGLPVAAYPGIIDPENFVHEVLTKRFPNSFVPDLPQRIAWDTSQKVPASFYTVTFMAPVVSPPSTIISWPVTYSDASEARKTAIPARSSGFPTRFLGMRSTM